LLGLKMVVLKVVMTVMLLGSMMVMSMKTVMLLGSVLATLRRRVVL